ncbi:MAG: gamma-glutamyl-gamma-aminobutyrate hydrolase family protein [Cardiobacteriaceae bacterium]|nr:gamma-glutamyl-gamma-aminobutyrate hydrolase family protein [Cardiobacteriaceae bacterium]
MSKRIAIILHNPQGSTGLIGELLTAAGHTLNIRCALAGDPLPAAEEFDAAIVFGGKMSANDGPELPALLDELLWIRACAEADKPFVGICLGAQLLAMSFGGVVTRHQERITEIGYHPVYPTVEGYNDIFANAPQRFFQWHNEGFTLPEGAVKLAASDHFPNQAFRLGNRVYGFQFHPEATPVQIAGWHRRDAEELAHPGAQTVRAQWRYCEKLSPAIRAWLNQFLQHWLSK